MSFYLFYHLAEVTFTSLLSILVYLLPIKSWCSCTIPFRYAVVILGSITTSLRQLYLFQNLSELISFINSPSSSTGSLRYAAVVSASVTTSQIIREGVMFLGLARRWRGGGGYCPPVGVRNPTIASPCRRIEDRCWQRQSSWGHRAPRMDR